MADYRKTCEEVLVAVGGAKNIVSVSHCATRLRLVLVDKKMFNHNKLNQINGVLGSFYNTGQLQIIFGPIVSEVYKIFIEVAGIDQKDQQHSAPPQQFKKQNIFMATLKTIPACVMPMLHVLMGCSLVTALMNVIWLICAKSFHVDPTTNSWFQLFQGIGTLCTGFLVVYICVSAAKLWNVDLYIAIAVGIFLAAGPSVGTLIPGWANYQRNAIGAMPYSVSIFTGIITIKFCSILQHWLDRKISDNWKMFILGAPCVVLSVLFSVLCFGPIMHWLEVGLGRLTDWLSWPGLYGFGMGLLGFLYAPLVITGVHQVFIPIIVQQMAETGGGNLAAGYSFITPFMIASNISQGAAAIAVALTTKDHKTKNLGLSTGAVALLGITEPAMFGINMYHKRAFLCAMVGSFVAAWFFGIMRVAEIGMNGVSPGVLTCMFGIPNPATKLWKMYDPFNTPNYINLIWMCLGIIIAFCVSFVFAMVFSRPNSTAKETIFARKLHQINLKIVGACRLTMHSKFANKIRILKNKLHSHLSIHHSKLKNKQKKSHDRSTSNPE